MDVHGTEGYSGEAGDGGGRVPLLVLYRPEEGIGYVPVDCVSALLTGVAKVMVDNSDAPDEIDLQRCAGFLIWHAEQIHKHLEIARLHAAYGAPSYCELDGLELRRGGIFNPRNWVTRRR